MIVGGNGLLGYHAAVELLKRGYRVSALALEDLDLEGWYPREIEVVGVNKMDTTLISPQEIIEKGALL